MDRSKFYAALRRRGSTVFGTSLSPGQVEGMEGILDEAERRKTRLSDLAYMLATTYHETAHTMQPIHERGQRAYFNKYEPGTKIGKMLGNTVAGDGYRFRGRGFVQLTGRANYAKASKKIAFDFIANPDLVLLLKHAIPILFVGMQEGWFTGKDLDDYTDGVTEDDKEELREFANARRIINGTDKAGLIADYALTLQKALIEAGYGIVSKPSPEITPKPVTPEPVTQKPETGGWAAFWSAVLALFNRKSA